jgi:hypothetical protein
MSTKNHIPNTVEASLDARLAPFSGIREGALEDLDAKMSRAGSPHSARPRLGLINDLKLLFAALAAGGNVVPLGDNSRTTRLLSEYAASLRSH